MKTKFSTLVIFFMFTSAFVNAQEPYIGEIKMFAGNFAPRGWAFCDGQILTVNQNSALFSLIGTYYGGDGRTTFALPDLRGRTPVHVGTGNGLTNIKIGQKGGAETKELKKVNVFEDPSGKSSETFTINSSRSKVNLRTPYLGVSYIIALQGIYPSRN